MKKKSTSKTASAKSGTEKKTSKTVKKTKAKPQKAVKIDKSSKAEAKNVTEVKNSEKAVSITKKESKTINTEPEENKPENIETEKISQETIEPEKVEQKAKEEKPKEPEVIDNPEIKEEKEIDIKEPKELKPEEAPELKGPKSKELELKEPEIEKPETKESEKKDKEELKEPEESKQEEKKLQAFAKKTDTEIDPEIEELDSEPKMFGIADKYTLIGIASSIALIFIMLVFASISNSNNYYIKKSYIGSTEIWKGSFAPLGMEKMLVIDENIQVADAYKDKYSKEEIFPIIFNYYIKKADEFIDIPGDPDFEKTRDNLTAALNYTISDEQKSAVYARLNIIDLMLLMYRADIAKKRGTLRDLEDAVYYLEEAALLDVDESQVDIIERKIASLKEDIEKKNLEDRDKPEDLDSDTGK